MRWAQSGSYVVALLLAACDFASQSDAARDGASMDGLLSGEERVAEIESIAGAVASHLRRHGPSRPSCGGEAALGAPTSVVITSAEQCLGCKDVGYLARELARRAGESGTSFWVVTSSADVEAVCEYLASERVPVPVYAAPDDVLSGLRAIDEIIQLDVTPDGEVARIAHGRDALALLEGIAADSERLHTTDVTSRSGSR